MIVKTGKWKFISFYSSVFVRYFILQCCISPFFVFLFFTVLYLSVSRCRNSYGESLETAACVSGCWGREGSQRLVVLL